MMRWKVGKASREALKKNTACCIRVGGKKIIKCGWSTLSKEKRQDGRQAVQFNRGL